MAGLKDFRHRQKKTTTLQWVDQQSIDLIFLRELSDAKFVVEHTNPDNWKRTAECTFPQCYGCERAYLAPYSGWSQKSRMYIDAEFAGEVVVVTQTLTKHGLAQKLIDYHLQHGTICGILFTVTRVGGGKKTKYLIKKKKKSPSTQQAIDLERQVNKIPYEQQEIYYNT